MTIAGPVYQNGVVEANTSIPKRITRYIVPNGCARIMSGTTVPNGFEGFHVPKVKLRFFNYFCQTNSLVFYESRSLVRELGVNLGTIKYFGMVAGGGGTDKPLNVPLPATDLANKRD